MFDLHFACVDVLDETEQRLGGSIQLSAIGVSVILGRLEDGTPTVVLRPCDEGVLVVVDEKALGELEMPDRGVPAAQTEEAPMDLVAPHEAAAMMQPFVGNLSATDLLIDWRRVEPRYAPRVFTPPRYARVAGKTFYPRSEVVRVVQELQEFRLLPPALH